MVFAEGGWRVMNCLLAGGAAERFMQRHRELNSIKLLLVLWLLSIFKGADLSCDD